MIQYAAAHRLISRVSGILDAPPLARQDGNDDRGDNAMNTSTMLRAFCDAVEQRNGKAFAELFTEDGVYHDVFYGAFEGRAKIAEHDRRLVLSHGHRFPLGHARLPSATATRSMRATPSATARRCRRPKGARAMFEGVAIMQLRDGKIAGVPRGRQHRAGLRRHQVRAGAHRQDRCQAGRGAEGAAGDEAASGVSAAHLSVVIPGRSRSDRTRNPLGRVS